jgi:hypothetical protein
VVFVKNCGDEYAVHIPSGVFGAVRLRGNGIPKSSQKPEPA